VLPATESYMMYRSCYHVLNGRGTAEYGLQVVWVNSVARFKVKLTSFWFYVCSHNKSIEKTKYMIIFRHQNSGKNQNIRTVNVPVLLPTEHHAMKAHWGVEVQLHPFFELGTRRR